MVKALKRPGLIINTKKFQDDVMRKRVLKLDGIKLETPILWLGENLGSMVRFWEGNDVEAIMVNAYDIVHHRQMNKILDMPISEFVGFDNVAIDCGMFAFYKHQESVPRIDELVDIYNKTKPTLCVSRDVPLDPRRSTKYNWWRVKKSIAGVNEMMGKVKSELMIAIQGYTPEMIDFSLENLNGKDYKLIAIGGIVPLIKSVNGVRQELHKVWGVENNRKIAISIINYIRKKAPDKYLHVFGVGGTNMGFIMAAMGIDSFDTIGHRIGAAYGFIHINGIGQRYISIKSKRGPKWNPKITRKEFKILSKCECPVCTMDRNLLKTSFKARVIHNAHVYQEETDRIREELRQGNIDKFVASRLKSTQMMKAFEYAKEIRDKDA